MGRSALPLQDARLTALMLLTTVVMAMGGKDFCSWKCAVFTQQWPSGFCKSLINQSDCIIPEAINDWTIHGLWPQTHTESSCDCWPLFRSDIQELEEELMQRWPTLVKKHTSFFFWSLEWKRHGSTAACEEGLNSPLRYFQTSLRLVDKFNLSSILKKADITPSCDRPYKVKELHGLLAPSFGEELEIQCVRDEKGRELWYQVKIPLSRAGFTVGCGNYTWEGQRSNPSPRNQPHPCPAKGSVYLLPINHQHPSEPCKH
ncbi:ribonuclease T2-like [Gouania willdenowi]|uniref:Ribonuclease Oy-like n=1 Tax=Gouania willdenowi TaxID=441366 RepID=A0A8C5DU68_GOUWI|nr:ribonuclease Oy-like [Gouania willdenowi]